MVRRGKNIGYKRRLFSICSKTSQPSAGRWLKQQRSKEKPGGHFLCSEWLAKSDSTVLVPKDSMALGSLAEMQKLSLSHSLFLRDDKQGGFGCYSGQSSAPVLASRTSSLTLSLPVLRHCQESFPITPPHIKTSNISREVTWSLSVQNKICKVPAYSKQQETQEILYSNAQKCARKVQTWRWILLWILSWQEMNSHKPFRSCLLTNLLA